MNVLLILPILIPLLTAAVSLLVYRDRMIQRWLGFFGTLGLFIVSIILLVVVWQDGIQVQWVGNWPAPFGITLVADLLSAIMVLLAGIVGLVVTVYSLVTIDDQRESFGYYPLMLLLLMGVCGSFLTGDLFNLYVWFEVMLIASFVLLVLGGERGQIEGAVKYVTLNLISSSIFLAAIGLLYGVMGTLNLADLSVKIAELGGSGIITTIAMLFLVAFGIKAAAFPFFFWLPASYHTPPIAVSAIFAGLLTEVGVYAMLRVFSLLFVHEVEFTHRIILIIAGASMITGVLGAVAQTEIRRILSFQIISHIGYMLMGLGIFTPLALAGSLFYIIHHVLAKANLFLLSGVIRRLSGSYELKELGGLYRAYPFITLIFFIPAFALAGIPPLSGFFAKFTLVRAGLQAEQYVVVAIALATSVVTLFIIARIWGEVFWKAAPTVEPVPSPVSVAVGEAEIVVAGGVPMNPAGGNGNGESVIRHPREVGPPTNGHRPSRDGLQLRVMLVPIIGLAILTIGVGLGAEVVMQLATRAAEQLLDSSEYVSAVLGDRP